MLRSVLVLHLITTLLLLLVLLAGAVLIAVIDSTFLASSMAQVSAGVWLRTRERTGSRAGLGCLLDGAGDLR